MLNNNTEWMDGKWSEFRQFLPLGHGSSDPDNYWKKNVEQSREWAATGVEGVGADSCQPYGL